MKYLLAILGILLAIPVIPFITGMFISETYSVTVSQTYNAPVASVWYSITEVENFPEWRTGVERVEIISDSGDFLLWKEYYAGPEPLTFKATTRRDSTQFVATIVDEDLPFGGSWTYRLEQSGTGVRLSITEDGQIYSPIYRFISRFIMGYTGTIRQYMDDLKQKTGT